MDYPTPVDGSVPLLLRRHVFSPQLRNFRDLIVALPPSYTAGTRRYPVIYLHDGQNLFDSATAFAADWRLGQTLTGLAAEGVETIVVGIPNTGRYRLYEYGPFHDRRLGGGGGDRYVDFLVHTVKPQIDRDFRTDPAVRTTVVAGSSMGGLISLYAFCRFPEVFGAAGVLSPALWFADGQVLTYAARWIKTTTHRRLYVDVGLDEGARAVADARALQDILLAAGLTDGRDYRYVEDEAGAHHEAAWSRRVKRALPYLLGATTRPDS